MIKVCVGKGGVWVLRGECCGHVGVLPLVESWSRQSEGLSTYKSVCGASLSLLFVSLSLLPPGILLLHEIVPPAYSLGFNLFIKHCPLTVISRAIGSAL